MNAAGEIQIQKNKPDWRWKWLLIVPGIWILLAELAHVYPGGENLNLGIGMLPAFLMAKLFQYDIHWPMVAGSRESMELILIGAIPMMIAGTALDIVGVSKQGFGIGILAGMTVAITLLAYSILNEGFRAGIEVAARRFDLDQPKRVIALTLSFLGIGFYVGVIMAALLNPISKRLGFRPAYGKIAR